MAFEDCTMMLKVVTRLQLSKVCLTWLLRMSNIGKNSSLRPNGWFRIVIILLILLHKVMIGTVIVGVIKAETGISPINVVIRSKKKLEKNRPPQLLAIIILGSLKKALKSTSLTFSIRINIKSTNFVLFDCAWMITPVPIKSLSLYFVKSGSKIMRSRLKYLTTWMLKCLGPIPFLING